MTNFNAIINSFMDEMKYYIRHNKNTGEWKTDITQGLCPNLELYVKGIINYSEEVTELKIIFRDHCYKYVFKKYKEDDWFLPFESFEYKKLKKGLSRKEIKNLPDPYEMYWNEVKERSIYTNPLRLSFIENWKDI